MYVENIKVKYNYIDLTRKNKIDKRNYGVKNKARIAKVNC